MEIDETERNHYKNFKGGKTMKKLIALQITLILLLTCILSACTVPESKDDIATKDSCVQGDSSVTNETVKPKEPYMLSDIELAIGTTYIYPNKDYEYIIAILTAEGQGEYIISAGNNAIGMVSDNGRWITIEPNANTVNTNTLTWNVKSQVDCLIAIENTSDIISVTVEHIQVPEKQDENTMPSIFENMINKNYKTEEEVIDAYNAFANHELHDVHKYRDYCICGFTQYHGEWYYPINISNIDWYMTYLVDFGYSETKEDADKRFQAYLDGIKGTDYEYEPGLFSFIKCFSVTKEDLYTMRDNAMIHFYYNSPESFFNPTFFPTNHQIEMLYGDYNIGFLMQELKNNSTYLHDGKLYLYSQLLFYTSDEILLEMAKQEDFRLYVDDMTEYISRGGNLGVTTSDQLKKKIERLLSEAE